MENNRLDYMDWLKGLAMFLVVAGHALLGMYQSGAFLGEEQFLFIAKEIIYSFHMPIFFMVSGFFYGKKQLVSADVWPFLKGKLIAFGVPYLIFAILQIAMQCLGGSAVRSAVSIKSFLMLFIKPVDYLWFLWALFLCFLVCVLLDVLIKNIYIVFGVCIILAVLSVIIKFKNPVLEYIFTYPFFFYLGKMILNTRDKTEGKKHVIAAVLGFLVLTAVNIFCLDSPR